MIYTVTLNPSIDFIVRLDSLALGSVNRMTSDDKFAGGKGINVSRILKRLDIENTATGFIGGFTGRFVKDGLVDEGIATKLKFLRTHVLMSRLKRVKKQKLMVQVHTSQQKNLRN